MLAHSLLILTILNNWLNIVIRQLRLVYLSPGQIGVRLLLAISNWLLAVLVIVSEWLDQVDQLVCPLLVGVV